MRFDAVYHGHFKCNLRSIASYPNLQGYLTDLYNVPGIAETVDFSHIKRHYYVTHTEINPTRIVPLGPLLDLSRPQLDALHPRAMKFSVPPDPGSMSTPPQNAPNPVSTSQPARG